MAVQFRDYYETLGVSKTASADEIKSAFRKLARKHHPDVAKDKKSAEEKFKQINEAYEVLSDPEKRQKYDQLGADWNQPGGGFQPPPGWRPQQGGGRPNPFGGGNGGGVEFEFDGTGFSDFFEAFFGGGRGQSAFGRGGGGAAGFAGGMQAERGSDVEADIMVTLEEALHGSKRTVSLRRSNSSKLESYQVKIPKGVHEGQRIRLAGQGEAGARGGKSGDLFLRVRLARHPDFSVEGSDLIHEVELAPWQAVLGSELQVPTLEGIARLKIPAGTSGGQRFRLRERGLPTSSGRGDLYVVTEIRIPKKLSDRERELWTELAHLHGASE
jgi:curved DNA-binding protein